MQREIEDQLRVLSDPLTDIDQIRLNIAKLIARKIEAARNSFSPWERFHFAHAISHLNNNIAIGTPSNTFWLRAALVALEKASTPPSEHSSQYPIQEEETEPFTYEALSNAIRQLGG
ncbi:MAG TPA: hypothetical protein VK959_00195 [Methylophilaceae bacterium]|nr:hypothetical protein [Methylophilaceae bacterium]